MMARKFEATSQTEIIPAEREEQDTREFGRALLEQVRAFRHHSPSDWFYDRLMRFATSDEALKVQLFRFVDALPALHSPHSVADHLVDSLTQPGLRLPPGARTALRLLRRSIVGELPLALGAQFGTRLMARRFIAASNAREAVRAVQRLRARKFAFSLDLLGEAVTSESEALSYQQKYLDLLSELTTAASRWNAVPQLDEAPFGPVPRVNVSVKLSSLYARFDPMAADATVTAVKARLRPILRLAHERGAFVNIDMEQFAYRDITRRIFEEVLLEDEFATWPDVGIVVQAYLQDAESDLDTLLAWARRRGTPVWVRLVKGAYWDYETMIAAQQGHALPVYRDKAETDANYERLTELLLRNWQHLRPAIATHNVRSAAHAQALAYELQLPARAIEFQVLYGMGEPIGRALAAQGERVRMYVPFGELLPGMAYLVRRLLENAANESFIRHIEQDGANDEELLAPPIPSLQSLAHYAGQAAAVVTPREPVLHNEPVSDFAVAANREKMATALEQVRPQLGMTVPIVIAGRHEKGGAILDRPDPSETSSVASRVQMATVEQARHAVAAAAEAFPAWRSTPVAERAALLRRVAGEFRRRRFEINAWQVYEVGKPWREADADVAEAIDFCEFYAAEMERLAAPRRRNVPGEWNHYIYDARGPAVVIAPWNFPLAILTGMTTAALVAGNPVVMKPSEQSSRIGYFLMEALQAAGVPHGVANFLPGDGETVGPVLVNDPRVALLAFTGSKAVGLSIVRDAADVQPGQREIKRVIAELGGKNAIIVDEDADLDEAVLGVLHSTIGYSGQKCSACSRCIVIGAAWEQFCARLAEAVRSIAIGPADDPATTLGPVVNADARERIARYIEIGKQEGQVLAEIAPSDEMRERGYYVPAVVFTGCGPDGRICQDEIFGPVLAVLHARDLDHALALAADSQYALTGGFYSRSPHNIERVRREFRVGNLYINRKITGALVDRQPFGGMGMSGVGSKAGGPDYLQQFLIPRTITELVMRRGFAPTEENVAEEDAEGI